MAVKSIPEGYHTITPSLIIRDAARALDYYKRAFGATETFRMAGPDGKVAHAEMKIGNSSFMLGEENVAAGMKSPQSLDGSPVSLYLYVEDCDRVFNQAVQAGSTQTMAPSDMFWGDRMASVTDPFGHRWSIATHKKDMTPEEIEKGSREFFAKMSRQAHG